MEFLIMVLIIAGVAYGARSYAKKHDLSSLPSFQQIKLEQEKEDYTVLGMMEINQFLAPRQLPEPVFVDVGCMLCDAMRMDVTENELEAEGWTCVNGTTRCPDCSRGKKPRRFLPKPLPPVTALVPVKRNYHPDDTSMWARCAGCDEYHVACLCA